MKLFSTNRNSIGKQLICDEAIFDIELITSLHIDEEEKVVTFQYDFTECGHPLNLPFDAQAVNFLVKFTVHDIHICAIVNVNDNIDGRYVEYIDGMDEIEFDVRMNVEEKYALLRVLFLSLLNKVKTREPITAKPMASIIPSISDKNYTFNESSFKEALREIFFELFSKMH